MPRTYNPEAQAIRFARCEQTLKEAGGRRINVRLSPKAAKRLDTLMRKTKVSQTEAVNSLLEG
jgi:molybdenum cofactor biosynthesis enzyme MoaA